MIRHSDEVALTPRQPDQPAAPHALNLWAEENQHQGLDKRIQTLDLFGGDYDALAGFQGRRNTSKNPKRCYMNSDLNSAINQAISRKPLSNECESSYQDFGDRRRSPY